MKKKLMLLFLVALAIIILGFIFRKESNTFWDFSSQGDSLGDQVIISIGNNNINTKVADDPKSLEMGLSNTESLGPNDGMFFVFDMPSQKFFWMKDMNFAIDIIWIDEDFKITGVVQNAQPSSYPKTFSSPNDTKYVLEVNSGYFAKHNLHIGDKVKVVKN